MKKVFALLTVVTVLSFVACKNNTEKPAEGDSTQTEQQADDQAEAEQAEADAQADAAADTTAADTAAKETEAAE